VRDLLRHQPGYPKGREALRHVLEGQARVLVKLGRHAEAIGALKECIALEDGPPQGRFRAGLAYALARAGNLAQAVAQMSAIDAASEMTPADCYTLARVWALVAAASAKDKSLPASEQCADRALGWLRKARDGGLFKDPRALAHIKADSDQDSLRGRADYKKFVAELEAASK
jgi:hypothetical protein